jgi:carbonic anhydrase/acetyltransferase-like protein (isoleucine patch superfamily)
MPIHEFGGVMPCVPDDAWVAPTAILSGDVWLACGASIWNGTVLRGDNGPISIGEGSNVQDLCVLHAAPGQRTAIGRGCSIGHGALLHGCRIGDFCLIGMGTILLDGADIGRNCRIGAGTLILAGTAIPENSLVVGQPARIIRQLCPDAADEQRAGAFAYEQIWRQARRDLHSIVDGES